MKDLSETDTINETGGTIKYDALSALKVSADLPFVGNFNIGNNYLRVYSVSRLGSKETTILHATLIPSRPATDYSSASATGTLDCYSLLKLLEDAATEEPITYNAGVNATGEATLLIAKVGLPFIADLSSMTLTSPRSYDAGTSYLEICNDLLAVAGFNSLEIDSLGTVRLTKYADPATRSPVWVLRDDDEQVVFSPDVSYEFDTFHVPNKVIAVKSATNSTPLTATALNDDPASIYSTVSRGRVIAHTETVSDVEGQQALNAVAKRVLAEKSSAVESINIAHPFLPYNTGDALSLSYTKHAFSFTGVAVSKELSLSRGMLCKTRIRRFVRR